MERFTGGLGNHGAIAVISDKRYQILGRRERNLKTLNPTEYTPLFKAG